MSNKITLITPPDFYENSNLSVLFIGLSESQQEQVSKWLGEHDSFPECNFYYYQGEPNATWLLYAVSRSDAIFLNYDSEHAIINIMGSYILGRPGVSYTTSDENLKALMSHINNQHVSDVEEFLKKVFNGKEQ
jgi:hypothetical protein